MNEKDAYREAMHESLKNAEQWLADAQLLANHGSRPHSFVLRDLAGEEIAKAYACWQVLVGALPVNHPLVRPNVEETTETVMKKLEKEAKRDSRRVRQGKLPKKQISVFSSHSMKYGLMNDLGSQFFKGEDTQEMTDETEAFLGSVNQMIGELGVLKRSEWMYVNLCKTENDLKVTSPLKSKIPIFDPRFTLKQKSLDAIKQLVSSSPVELSQWVQKRKKALKKLDAYFPRNPKWIG